MALGIIITVNNKSDDWLTGQVSTVEVYEKIDDATSYRIRFMVDICDEDIAANLTKITRPDAILGILVQAGDQLNCLVSGPVSRQQAYLQQGGSGSWLDVEGTDFSRLMDKEMNFHSQTGNDSDIVSGILQPKYVQDTDVEDTPDNDHSEDTHTSVQKETDLSYVRKMAQRNGFHFWLTYDEDGNATGHFRSRNLQGEPVAELILNADKPNVDNLQIKWDTNRPTQVEGRQVDLANKSMIGGAVTLSDTETLGATGFAQAAGTTPTTMQIAPPADSSGALNLRAQAVLKDAQWFISATCKTTMDRICTLLRFHTIVSVAGLGSKHSGKYYVTGVKHSIDMSAHVMELELARNAWGDQIAAQDLVSKIF